MLTDAEYHYVIRHRTALQQEIDAKRSEYDDLGERREKVKDDGLALREEMTFYTNFLKNAIDEYEAAHPPEGE